MSAHLITIEETNHPAILKFNSNQILTKGGSFQYNNIDEAKESPLAQQLFHLPFVQKIFITANFIAIEKFDIIDWRDVQEELKIQIKTYLDEGNSVLSEIEESKKFAVEIYAESTPNPMVMKFGCSRLLSQKDFEYKNATETANSPLARDLFKFPFVKEIYIAENYISITKNELLEWNDIIAEIRDFIRAYILDRKIIVDESVAVEESMPTSIIDTANMDPISKEIISILDTYVKPAVAADGGNILFDSYHEETKTVHVVLQGACSGCPSSTITLKNGIETMLKEMLPNKIHEVVAVNG